MPKMKGVLLSVVALGVASIAYLFFFRTHPIEIVDRLCEYVRGQQMNCVATLAADSLVHPGSILSYVQSENPTSDRLPLPISDITGSSCLVPGTQGVTEAIKTPSAVSMPKLSYEINGALAVGANVELPELYGTTIKAGPEWSDVQKVEMSVDDAWVTQLDENLAIYAVRSCSFRKICVDRIKSKQYRVVGTSLIAKGLNYKFYNKSGEMLSLNAAATAKIFSASLGASSNIHETTDATIKAADPRVVGLSLLPIDVFEDQPVCEDAIVLSADGNATVAIGGGGGRGNIGSSRTQRTGLNDIAEVAATGSERSECNGGFERKVSGASASASVAEIDKGKLQMTYNIAASGGHYVTAAACAAGVVIGKTGHDTGATASADLIGTISALVRSEDSPILRVEWQKMPQSGAEIRILDWNGENLSDPKTGEPIRPISAEGNGGLDVATRGPGVYRVETRMQLNSSVNGNSNSTQSETAEVTVNIVGSTN
jgi:hypothetical protein